MSLAARLDSLRRQAGASVFGLQPLRPRDHLHQSAGDVSEVPHPAFMGVSDAAPSNGVDEMRRRVASLRRALGQREEIRHGRHAQSRGDDSSLQDRALPGLEVAPDVRLIEQDYRAPFGSDALIELSRMRSPSQQRRVMRLDPDSAATIDARNVLAIDTETTGLAGGTGTRAFMIGVAVLEGERLQVRQLLITRLSSEPAMLRIFLSWLREDHVLISYNGRSYDRPLLSTRLRLARLPDPLSSRVHLDLLHVTRRAYRGVWPNCRLATAERELLGVVRDDDLPGAEAPAAWLGFLRGGSAAALRRVVTHNDQDLRSLVGLLAHFARLLPAL